MTSYWPAETSDVTGSGLKTSSFEINGNGWYTYKGKLVLAGATAYLLKYGYAKRDGIHYFKYYDTVTVNIDGVKYDGIIIDSCGACMKKPIIDLFVVDGRYSITTNVKVEIK